MAASTAWGAGAIDTNRPGFSFSPATVMAGTWQLETGFEYTRGNGANRTYEIPIAELRLGVAGNLTSRRTNGRFLDRSQRRGNA